MSDALIGHTGFIGGALLRQRRFDELYNSKNVEDITGRSFDLLIASAMPAAKWIANRDPEGDRAVLDRLVGRMQSVKAQQAIVVSTVDVYPSPIDVDEDSPIDPAAQQPYGRHRLMLEQAATRHFPSLLVVRLPAMFGPGLRKNAVYDLLHDNDTHKIHSGGVFQFYNVERLWRDLQIALAAKLLLVNIATEPVSMTEVARDAFGMSFDNDTGQPPARYDMRSRHAAHFGGANGYLYSKKQVLDQMREFVERERKAMGR